MEPSLIFSDPDPQNPDLRTKVLVLAGEFYQKFRVMPNVCYVNPTTAGFQERMKVENVKIKRANTVAPGSFWIGVE